MNHAVGWEIYPQGSQDGTTGWREDSDGRTAIVDAARSDGTAFPQVHPGVFDATGGFRSHRVEIHFETTWEPAPTVLHLEFAVERGPCPDLEVVLDDEHRGLLHPTVERNDRTRSGEPGPVAGTVDLVVEIPAEWLRAGRHVLSIATVLDEASSTGERDDASHIPLRAPREDLPAAREHYGTWFGSFIRWSRIALTAAETRPHGAPRADVRATPFFVETPDGVRELIDLNLTWSAGTKAPDGLVMHIGDATLKVPSVPADRDFGMFRWRFVAPEMVGATRVDVEGGGIEHTTHVTPARQWTLHLIPHIHLDLGFTDAQGKVLELHCRNIDRAIDRFESDPAFRFHLDGAMIAQEYLRTRSRAQGERMLAAIRGGGISVNALHSNQLTGVMSLAELLHSGDAAAGLPHSEVTRMRVANLTDVPTATSALPTVLRALDIDAFVNMSNHGRAITDSSDAIHLASPVRWRGPDGSEVLAYFADHYSQLRFIAADPQAVSAATDGLDRLLRRFERPDYLPTDLPVIGTHADNEDLADGDTSFVVRWNARFAYPRFRISSFEEYFARVASLDDQLPVWTADEGSYWEDGVGSVTALFALHRRAQAHVPAVETLGAALAVLDPRTRTNRAELDRAWADLAIGAEHTFTWARSTSHPHAFPVADQLGWKARHIQGAERVASDEMRRQLARLAEVVGVTGPGYLAYNPHPWPADLEAELDVIEGVDLLGPDGAVPLEVLSSCHRMRRCRISLPAMPAHSYRYFPASAGRTTVPGGEGAQTRGMVAVDVTGHDAASEEAPPEQAVSVGLFSPVETSEPISSSTWDVRLDPSSTLPIGLRHLPTGREVIDPTAGVALGQLLRTAHPNAPADDGVAMLDVADVHMHSRRVMDLVEDRYAQDADGSIARESPKLSFSGVATTFDGIRLRWRGAGANLRDVRVDLLLRDDGSADLDIAFVKAPCHDAEGIYVSFPFAAREPRVRYDRQLGWVDPERDHGPGASNEWASATDAVVVSDESGSIVWTPLDAPLFTVGDIVRGAWPDRFKLGAAHLYSFAMNNFWPCNTPPAQEGTVRLRYRITVTNQVDDLGAHRLGRRARVGAQIAEILPLDRFLPDTVPTYAEGRLLGDVPEGVDIQLVQRDDNEFTLLLQELTGADRTVELSLPRGLHTSEGAANQVGVALRSHGIAMLALDRTFD